MKEKNYINIVLIILACIGGILALVLTINNTIMTSRVTYNTESTMKTDISGVWVEDNEELGNYKVAFDIQGNKLIKHRYSDDEGREYDIKFVPSRGKFITDIGTFVVKKASKTIQGKKFYLEMNGQKYRLGGLDLLDRDPSSPSYESDWRKAEIAALGYSSSLSSQHPEILSVTVNGKDGGSGSGEYYNFSCRVVYKNGKIRNGYIVVKRTNGNFQAKELRYTD